MSKKLRGILKKLEVATRFFSIYPSNPLFRSDELQTGVRWVYSQKETVNLDEEENAWLCAQIDQKKKTQPAMKNVLILKSRKSHF